MPEPTEQEPDEQEARIAEQKGRRFTVQGSMRTQVSKGAIMKVLTDYDRHAEMFSSITKSKVLRQEGNTAEIYQEGNWQMLWLRGNFNSTLRMTADPKAGTMTAELLKSTLFEDYEAQWQVNSNGKGASVQHQWKTKPKGTLPPGFGRYLGSVFIQQEHQLLSDLKVAARQTEQRHNNALPLPRLPMPHPMNWLKPLQGIKLHAPWTAAN